VTYKNNANHLPVIYLLQLADLNDGINLTNSHLLRWFGNFIITKHSSGRD